MTYFPHHPSERWKDTSASSLKQSKPAANRDVLWGRPLFKAPHLPNPRVAFDPLPFTALRVTHRASLQAS